MRARFNPKTTGTAYFDDFSITQMERAIVVPPAAIDDENGLALQPTEYRLAQNYPNPFNPETNILFSLPRTGFVRLDVYNILGQKVATLIDGIYESGTHNVNWMAVNDYGQPVSSGIYFYTLITRDTRITKKMLLLR